MRRNEPVRRSALAIVLIVVSAISAVCAPVVAPPAVSARAAGGGGALDALTAPHVSGGVPRSEIGPAGDAFYTPPSPLPAGRPGDVLRHRAVTVPTGLLSPPARGHLVMYLSRTATGRLVAVTGTVILPERVDPARTPIVAFGTGTQGIDDSCAPSKALQSGLLVTDNYFTELLRRGWAVAVTDYEGLGTPGDHTYAIGRSQGRALLDVARAAQRLPAVDLGDRTPVGVIGYSQGGGGAAWAAELQASYAPDLRLVGVAAGGAPADLATVAAGLDGSFASALLGYAAIGLDAAYPELALDSYLTAFGRTVIADLRRSCSVTGIPKYPFLTIDQLAVRNPLEAPDWQRRMAENSLGRVAPRAPVFLWHGLVDEVVPFSQADALRRDWCRLGARVTWRPFLAEHVTGQLGTHDAIGFLADRFAGGRPLPGDTC